MNPHARRVAAAAVFGYFLGVSPALADPIVIRSGDLFADHLDPSGPPIGVHLAGDGGFTLSIRGTYLPGAVSPVDTCGSGAWPTCSVGDPISIAAHLFGSNAFGTATLDGVTYSSVGGSNPGDPQVSLQFSGPDLIAPDGFSVSGPFTFAGVFSFTDPGGMARTQQLVGGGVVRLSFHRGFPNQDSLDLTGANYEFADPIPEPASMLLVGTGVALAARRMHRRRI